MRSLVVAIVATGLVCFSADGWAGEKLVYAVAHKGSDYQVEKTELFSVDPESGRWQLVFTDEDSPIVLLERLYVFHFPVAGGGRVFAHAARRGESVPFPGNADLYELTIDGSGSFKTIAPASGDESLGEIFVNTAGTRIGYLNLLNQKRYIFIYDAATGKLMDQVDVTDIFLDCYASGIGWLCGADTLFYSLDTGDVHVTSEESYDAVGTYLMDESGENVRRLDPVPIPSGYQAAESVRMIGSLPTGRYVFEMMLAPKLPAGPGAGSSFTVVRWKPGSDSVDDIGFSQASRLYSGVRVEYSLSPSGRYLAAAALPISSSAVTGDIWLKDLESGGERKLVSIPANGLQGPFLGLAGWVDR
jgi:hypothetical protein